MTAAARLTEARRSLGARLPAGWTERPMRLDDAARLAEIANVTSLRYTGRTDMSEADMLSELTEPGRDLQGSSAVAVDPSGAIQGALHCACRPPFTEPTSWIELTDEARTLGLGPHLMTLVEPLHEVLSQRAERGSSVRSRMIAWAEEEDGKSWFRAAGMEPIRYFSEYEIDLPQRPEEPVLPDGFHLRTFVRGQDEERTWRADRLGFADHWGDSDDPFDTWVHRHIEANERFDPTLWFLVEHDGEIVSLLTSVSGTVDDERCGYLEHLTTLPAFRRRGLGRMLLLHALAEFRRRGLERASLHADADSPTGAMRLYESIGMRGIPRFEIWGRALR